MNTQMKFIFFIQFICFFTGNLFAISGDTIVIGAITPWQDHHILATPNKQFSVDWGDGSPIQIFTGEEMKYVRLRYDYSNSWKHKIIISGFEDCFFTGFDTDRADTLDFSRCPSIKTIYCTSPALRSLNTQNCINLEEILVFRVSDNGLLTVLDLRDNIALKDLLCWGNQLTHIELGVKELKTIGCWNNRLKLSYLYAFSEMVKDPWAKILGPQKLLTQKAHIYEPVDFSDQNEFGGIKTVFRVEKGDEPAPQEDYEINEGFITFHKTGIYSIIMTNAAIVAYQGSNVVVAPIEVWQFIPVSEIVNVPEKAIAGKALTLTGWILPQNATGKKINWSVKDTGTTGATINLSVFKATAPGMAVITATIENGLAMGVPYTQDFCIAVEPLGVTEPAGEIFSVWPNPTTGELRVTSYELQVTDVEVYDIYGRKQNVEFHSYGLTVLRSYGLSNLQSGIYFVKIITNAGEIVKKVVKQ